MLIIIDRNDETTKYFFREQKKIERKKIKGERKTKMKSDIFIIAAG